VAKIVERCFGRACYGNQVSISIARRHPVSLASTSFGRSQLCIPKKILFDWPFAHVCRNGLEASCMRYFNVFARTKRFEPNGQPWSHLSLSGPPNRRAHPPSSAMVCRFTRFSSMSERCWVQANLRTAKNQWHLRRRDSTSPAGGTKMRDTGSCYAVDNLMKNRWRDFSMVQSGQAT